MPDNAAPGGAPAESGAPAPAQKETAPAGKETAPAEKEAAPTEEGAAPGEKDTAPTEEGAAPGEKDTAPGEPSKDPGQGTTGTDSRGETTDPSGANATAADDGSKGELERRVDATVRPADERPVQELGDRWGPAGADMGNASDGAERAAAGLPDSWRDESGQQMRDRTTEAAHQARDAESAVRAVRDQLDQTAADFANARQQGSEASRQREGLYQMAKTGPGPESQVIRARLEHDAVREVDGINNATAAKVHQDWDRLNSTLAAAGHAPEPPPEPGSDEDPAAPALDVAEAVAQSGIDLSHASQDLENRFDEAGDTARDWLTDTGGQIGGWLGGQTGEGVGRFLGQGLGDDVGALVRSAGELVEGGGRYVGNALETSGNATREMIFNASENDPLGALQGAAAEMGEGIGNAFVIAGETANEAAVEATGAAYQDSAEALADAQEALDAAGKDPGQSVPGQSAAPLASNSGPVVFYPRDNYTPQQMAEVREHVRLANEALQRGRTAPQGRRSTRGWLRTQATEEARRERVRADQAGTPYQGVVGHAPDTTWTGYPQAYAWHDEHNRVNSMLGGQARRYPIGWQPTEFVVGPQIRPGEPLPPR